MGSNKTGFSATIILVIAVAIIVASAYLYQTKTKHMASDAMMSDKNSESLSVEMSDYSGSGQTGTAVLTDLGNGQTKVTLEMVGYDTDEPQPAHIHSGPCPKIGPVIYPLTAVMNGTSETVIEKPLEEILKSAEELDINVHESVANIQNYTSCGDFPSIN